VDDFHRVVLPRAAQLENSAVADVGLACKIIWIDGIPAFAGMSGDDFGGV
jgi:hypothetical protein